VNGHERVVNIGPELDISDILLMSDLWKKPFPS
jgi:hypothetical protein